MLTELRPHARTLPYLPPGQITTNEVRLLLFFFMADAPFFTLISSTSGGPPESYTWTRNGEEISDGGSYSISIGVSGHEDAFTMSRYVCSLRVIGNLPGVYQYSVSNRAMSNMRTASYAIEGTSNLALHAVASVRDLNMYSTDIDSSNKNSSTTAGAPPTDLSAQQTGLTAVLVSCMDCTNGCSQWGVQDNCRLNRHQYWHRHHIISTHDNSSTTWCA